MKLKTFVPFLALLFLSCGSQTTVEKQTDNSDYKFKKLYGHLAPVVPKQNPISEAKVELGRYLFFDKRLSPKNNISCGSCHEPQHAFVDKIRNFGEDKFVNSLNESVGGVCIKCHKDGQIEPNNTLPLGTDENTIIRESMGLTNAAYYTSYTWANSALGTIERYITTPLSNDDPKELGLVSEHEDLVFNRILDDETYQKLFQDVFGDDYIVDQKHIVFALSSFIRTLISFNSPYDQYLAGNHDALSDEAKRGKDLFFGEKAECFHCHSGGDTRFSDSSKDIKTFEPKAFFHNTGLFNIDENGSFPEGNRGLFEITTDLNDMGKFKAPTLRNIELTAPYMHDGSLATLHDVLDFYSNGGRVIENGKFKGDGRANPHKSSLISKINLNEQEKLDIIEFLKSLTDYSFLVDPKHQDPFKKR